MCLNYVNLIVAGHPPFLPYFNQIWLTNQLALLLKKEFFSSGQSVFLTRHCLSSILLIYRRSTHQKCSIWPQSAMLVPIAEDNGDYYCMNEAGEVLFWSHNGSNDEKWPNLENWIREVWRNEN